MKQCLLIIAIVFLGSCSSQKNVIGCYASNFAEMGFFGEHLHLNKDSTFDYRFAGDLVNKVGHGRYYLNKDTVILLIHRNEPKTITDSLTYLPYLRDTIRFYFQNKRLFGININTHKVVKYAHGYSKNKRYIFFGSRHYKMRHYLKQHPCEIWND